MLRHWNEGPGKSTNESRTEALEVVEVKDSISDAIEVIEKAHGQKPKVIVTDARFSDGAIGYSELREMIFDGQKEPYLLLLGTGSGLAKEVMDEADYRLKPVSGLTGYNHLSVRSAAAIILDRLLSSAV